MKPDTTIAHRICPLCEACCGLEIKLQGGVVTSVRGHEADTFSKGYICPKGVSLKDLHNDPDRLRSPLIKRNGTFVEASWDEAFAEIERRLPPIIAAHGADAVASVFGNPSSHKIGLMMYSPRLARALGSRNIFSTSTLDQMPKHLSAGLMFGHWLSIPVPDIERADYLIILGANPMVSNGSLWTVPDYRGKAKAMRARGGRIVVIDPRRNETAELADEHHFIRPSADVFLLLGMLHTLFAEGRVRPGKLTHHLAGLDALQDAMAAFSAERMATRCGIAADDIRHLARDLSDAPRGAIYGRLGTCTQEYGTLCSWLIDVLNVVTGHLDQDGGAMFPKAAAFAANTLGKPGMGKGISTGRRKARVSGAPEIMGEFPIVCLAEEIETPGSGQIKALVTLASNLALSAPNSERLAGALDKLDFMVSIDIYLNETTRHADVILPGSSPLEDSHYDMFYTQFAYRNAARFSEAVLARPDGHPAEWEIILRLAAIATGKGAQADIHALDDEQFGEDVRRALGDHADAALQMLKPLRGPERQIDFALRMGAYGDRFGIEPDGLNLAKLREAEGGIDLGPLAPRIPEILRTPSGKIELAPPSLLTDLERAAADLTRPVPELVIIGRRQVRSCNSWMHNLPTLAKGPFRCTVLVHPQDVARYGLIDGGQARIANGARSILAQVEMSNEMMPGVISLPHGWGHDMPDTRLHLAAERPGANLNLLLDEDLRDPLSGNAVLSGIPVEMCAAEIPEH